MHSITALPVTRSYWPCQDPLQPDFCKRLTEEKEVVLDARWNPWRETQAMLCRYAGPDRSKDRSGRFLAVLVRLGASQIPGQGRQARRGHGNVPGRDGPLGSLGRYLQGNGQNQVPGNRKRLQAPPSRPRRWRFVVRLLGNSGPILPRKGRQGVMFAWMTEGLHENAAERTPFCKIVYRAALYALYSLILIPSAAAVYLWIHDPQKPTSAAIIFDTLGIASVPEWESSRIDLCWLAAAKYLLQSEQARCEI